MPAGTIRAVAFAGLIALVAGCSGQASPDPMPPPPEVGVAPVRVENLHHWDDFTGRIEATEYVELRPRVAGYIDRVRYDEGGIVEAGEVLFVIDQRPYRAALERARAELKRARTQTELARTELERAKKLADARAISAEELDQRQAALTQAEANAEVAEAALFEAELEMEFTEVRAPISGRVGHARVTGGNLVSTEPNATVLTTIVAVDPLYVYFEGDEQVYLRYVEMARNGDSQASREGGNQVLVGLAGDAGFPYEGVVDFIDNQIDAATGTIRARAVLPNPDGLLTPGLFARVRLIGNNRFQALLIDDRAVLTDQDRKFVYVVDDDSRAQRRDVVLGRVVEGLRVVQSGLEPGEQVIVNGVQKVFFPGMPVRPELVEPDDRLPLTRLALIHTGR